MLEKITKINYNVAIYIRLSKEDIEKGYENSESVKNQKILLTEYVENLGAEYKLVDIYIDDGYTGTNFNRPEFKRMINDIEQDKVNMVITKDLSRLGRDYVGTGEFLEKFFPEKNIRYVSVNDGIDTFLENNGNNDVAPFKAILNDMYSKDLSKKVKTARHIMQKQGKWVGGLVPLGYMQDPNDKNHFIICEEEAQIVRKIFDMALTGIKIHTIRDYLNDNNIPTLYQLRRNKYSFWENKAVKNILRQEAYIGRMVQNKSKRISYKNRKLRPNAEENWIIVENTHEPIIEKEKFYAVQKMEIVRRYERNEKKHYFLLDGLLICYECKHKIGLRVSKNGRRSMICNYYRRNSRLSLCTSHGFNYEKLEENVLKTIREIFEDIDNNKIKLNIKNNNSQKDYKKIMNKIEQEIKSINSNIDQMYLDKINGKLSEEMYERLFEKLTQEGLKKEEEYNKIKKVKEETPQENDEQIMKIIKEFLQLEKPTPELMRMIINRIEIHQDKQVDIIFNFQKLNKFLNKECLI